VIDKDELIESCRAMVIHYARRLTQLNGPLALEDAIGEGNVGLVRAANTFDPERGISFSTYAAININGAIIDALRRVSPGSRSARREFRAYEQVRGEMMVELGREPEEAEVAVKLNVETSHLEDMHRYRNLRMVSIESEFDGAGESDLSGGDDTEESVLSRIEALEVRQLVASLMPREREIIHRHYLEGHSQKRIALDMGVSESRISQLQRRALVHLRALMVGYEAAAA
jgi:RNA polymerase sigma factor for flagellar operon FliA